MLIKVKKINLQKCAQGYGLTNCYKVNAINQEMKHYHPPLALTPLFINHPRKASTILAYNSVEFFRSFLNFIQTASQQMCSSGSSIVRYYVRRSHHLFYWTLL